MRIVRIAFTLGIALSQAALASQNNPAAASIPTTDSQTLDLIERCREGIEDPAARLIERKRWGETLLSIDAPEARTLAIDLLGKTTTPEIPRALCSVIADHTVQSTDGLPKELVDPLIVLLGAQDGELRSLAARALAEFPYPEVTAALGNLAAQKDAPLEKRLAAIDALEPNTHRRDVVAQLIHLLDCKQNDVVKRVRQALEPVVPKSVGTQIEDWMKWWKTESRLSEDAWQARQLKLHRDRWRQAESQLQQREREYDDEVKLLTAQIQKYQREIYRSLGPDQRDGKILEWLKDPLPIVNRTAMAMIKARIADEGIRPDGAILAALLDVLESKSPTSRVDALEICQNLSQPIVVEKILARLPREQDMRTRRAIFDALGSLQSPAALQPIIDELANPDSDLGCIESAAIALGKIAGRVTDGDQLAKAAAVLSTRYGNVPEGHFSLQSALLQAMVGVGDKAFAPAFISAIDENDPTVLREALRGIRKMKDGSKLPRIRTLASHTDPFVRIEAITALGEIGVEDADLEPILARLRAAEEPNERARDAAWRSFLVFCSRRATGDQVAMAQRLREMPELEARYLTVLLDVLAATNDGSSYLESVRDRLATVLMGLRRYQEAIAPLQTLWGSHRDRGDEKSLSYGIRLLAATLRKGTSEQVLALLDQLTGLAASPADEQHIVQTIGEAFAGTTLSQDPDRAQALYDALRSRPAKPFGSAWTDMLDQITLPKSLAQDGGKTPTERTP